MIIALLLTDSSPVEVFLWNSDQPSGSSDSAAATCVYLGLAISGSFYWHTTTDCNQARPVVCRMKGYHNTLYKTSPSPCTAVAPITYSEIR